MDDFFGISIIVLKKGIAMLLHPKNKWKLATDPAKKFLKERIIILEGLQNYLK